MKQILRFIRQETVLCAAGLLAVLSAFFVPPSAEYLHYPDYRVLALLFGLMLVVAGFRSIGFFDYLGERLLKKAKSARSLNLLLVFLCFFSAMLITNDVALLTFVPFAVILLSMAGKQKLLIPVVALQTIAANLGSMLTPVGNPQNLYLYSAFSIPVPAFLLHMLPLTLSAAVLLAICVFLLPDSPLPSGAETTALLSAQTPASAHPEADTPAGSKQRRERPCPRKLLLYSLLFLICLLCVLRILSWQIMLGILIITVFFTDRKLFGSVDYLLLLTFVCFFLFIGNVQQIPAVSGLLRSLISGHELLLGVLFSQCISNVPAAMLVSGFTSQALPLLYGVNLGGLGTLIASLASVISYRLYGNSPDAKKGAYLKTFTLYNLVFLAVLYAIAMLLCADGF